MRPWLLFLCACGSETYIPPGDGGAGAACVSRSGNYVAHFVERPGGTCGAVADSVVPADTVPAGCQGSRTPSADNCSIDINQTCTVSGQTFKQTGTSHWTQDGSTGSAVITLSRATPSCTSTYDVTFTKA
jgi:hypothetical protein